MISRLLTVGFASCLACLSFSCSRHVTDPPRAPADSTQYPIESDSALVQQFENTTIFWKQFEVAKKIVALRDKSVLQGLEPWLSNDDMRRRGNAAFHLLQAWGDERGFQQL